MAEGGGGKSASGSRTHAIQNYLDKRQATVAEWVALRSIFEVCVRDMGYTGGGKVREPWWRQAAADKQLRETLEEILATAREWHQREYGRSGRGEGREVGRGY